MLVRWLTGHAFLRMQNHRADMADTPMCRACGEKPERADHILLECDSYAMLRAECFNTYSLDVREPQWTVEMVLKFLRSPTVSHLEEDEQEREPAHPRGQSVHQISDSD